jgi:hypothetical protein
MQGRKKEKKKRKKEKKRKKKIGLPAQATRKGQTCPPLHRQNCPIFMK